MDDKWIGFGSTHLLGRRSWFSIFELICVYMYSYLQISMDPSGLLEDVNARVKNQPEIIFNIQILNTSCRILNGRIQQAVRIRRSSTTSPGVVKRCP